VSEAHISPNHALTFPCLALDLQTGMEEQQRTSMWLDGNLVRFTDRSHLENAETGGHDNSGKPVTTIIWLVVGCFADWRCTCPCLLPILGRSGRVYAVISNLFHPFFNLLFSLLLPSKKSLKRALSPHGCPFLPLPFTTSLLCNEWSTPSTTTLTR
jgi:hypothetical protein